MLRRVSVSCGISCNATTRRRPQCSVTAAAIAMPPGVSGDGQRIWHADAGPHKPAVVFTVTSSGCKWSAGPGRRTVAMARRREQACGAANRFSELIHAHSFWRAPATAICIFERSTTWAGGRAARSHGTFGIQDRRIHLRILSLSFLNFF